MCARFGWTKTLPHYLEVRDLLDALNVDSVADEGPTVVPAALAPRYNIAPTEPVLVARTRRVDGAVGQRQERRLEMLRWGLIPSWSKDATIGTKTINARAETVAVKPSFRGAWKAGRRCLILADVFLSRSQLQPGRRGAALGR
jgi:putative SOS response-associated peptidase YedK